MRRLVLTELNRYRSRRLLAYLMLATVLLGALLAFKSAWDTRPPTRAELSTAEARAKMEASRADIQADLHTCLRNPADYLGKGNTAQDCRDNLLPAATSFLPRSQLDLGGTLKGNGSGIAALVIALLVVAGASFAGSDWRHGAMTTQLLAQPRRVRLWWAKAAAVALASAAVAAVALAVFWLVLFAVTGSREIATSGVVTGDVVQQVLRASLLAAAAGVGAYALTIAFRSTVGVLSLCFAFAMLGELLVALPFEGAARWSLGNNVYGWIEKHLEYQSPSVCSRAGECSPLEHMSHLESGLYLAVLLLVVVAVSVNMFRRTDA